MLFFIIPARAQRVATVYNYNSYEYDSDRRDTSKMTVTQVANKLIIRQINTVKSPIPGFADEWTLVDQSNDSIYYHYRYPDSTYCAVSTQSRNDIKWDTQIVDSKTTRYVTSINSNRIELLFCTKSKANINPLPYYGKFKGTLKQMTRNGLVQIELGDIISDKKFDSKLLQPSGIRKTGR